MLPKGEEKKLTPSRLDRLVILDTETGGLDPAVHSILSLAVVIWTPEKDEDSYELMIAEPNIVAEREALLINGIDLDKLRVEGKTPISAATLLFNFIRRHFPASERPSLVGHNIHFDVAFLKRLFALANCETEYDKIFSHRTLDTAGIGRFLNLAGILNVKNSSDALFTHFGIMPACATKGVGRHTALGDAKATGELLRKLIATVKEGK